MGRISAVVHLSLDGVMQAPGGADEDRRGGFDHGGWAHRYVDQDQGAFMGKGMAAGGAMLFGRRTYEQFASFWPTQGADNPFAAHLNKARKYVVSTTLEEPLPWENSILLRGDAAEAVSGIDENLSILGSATLVRSLMEAKLIDALTLTINPIVLGTGLRLFPEEGPTAEFRLVESIATSTGVLIGRYEAA